MSYEIMVSHRYIHTTSISNDSLDHMKDILLKIHQVWFCTLIHVSSFNTVKLHGICYWTQTCLRHDMLALYKGINLLETFCISMVTFVLE